MHLTSYKYCLSWLLTRNNHLKSSTFIKLIKSFMKKTLPFATTKSDFLFFLLVVGKTCAQFECQVSWTKDIRHVNRRTILPQFQWIRCKCKPINIMLECSVLSFWAPAREIIVIIVIDEFIMDAVVLFNIINIANVAWLNCKIATNIIIYAYYLILQSK